MVSIRFAILWAAVAAGMLYLAYLNPDSVHFTLSTGKSMDLPLMIPVMAAFFLGALCVPILYSVESVTGFFSSMKRKAMERRGRRAGQLYELGSERMMTGSRRDAAKYLSKALALNPDHFPSLLALGAMRRRDGDLTEAIKLHSRARGLNERSAAALLELAEDYYKAEQFVNAVSTLMEAQKIAGESLPAMERIRDVYVRAGNLKEAIATQRKVVENLPVAREPEGRGALAALMYQEAADFLSGSRLAESRDGLKAAIRADSRFVPAYLKLAEVYERMGEAREARKTLEWGYKSTLSLIPLKALELYLRAKGEREKVVEIYLWARGFAPDDMAVRLLLAAAYIDKGDAEAAQRELSGVGGPMADVTLRALIEGKIHRAQKSDLLAVEALNKAYDREMEEFFHFTCSACGAVAPEYSGRCPRCGKWDGLRPVLY